MFSLDRWTLHLFPEETVKRREGFVFVLWAGVSTLPLPGVRLVCHLAPFLQSCPGSPGFTRIDNFQAFLQAGLTVQNGGAGLGLAGGRSSEPAANRDLGRRRAELRSGATRNRASLLPAAPARPAGKVQQRSWGRSVRTGLAREAEGGQ